MAGDAGLGGADDRGVYSVGHLVTDSVGDVGEGRTGQSVVVSGNGQRVDDVTDGAGALFRGEGVFGDDVGKSEANAAHGVCALCCADHVYAGRASWCARR